MEYEAIASKERLTGRAYFWRADEIVTTLTAQRALDLGNIQMMNLDYGIKRKEHYKARRGMVFADRFDAYGTVPKWEITGDEFATPLLPLIFLGTAAADVNTDTIDTTFSFCSKKGRTFSIGKYGIVSASLTVPGSKVEGYNADYVIDRGPGKVYIPLGSTIADGTPPTTNCTVTYVNPLTVYNRIMPVLSTLNISGTMELIEEDAYDVTGAPKSIHNFPCILSTDSGGSTKVDDFKEFKLICTVSDPTAWSVLKRKT